MSLQALIDLSTLNTIEDLCYNLQCTPRDLQRMTDVRRFVQAINIRRRKSLRPRLVYRIQDPLRRTHRLLALALYARFSPWPQHVQGYTKGRSWLTNAKIHVSRDNTLSFDLEAFFDHVGPEQVAKVWEKAGTSRRVAVALTQLCTLDRKLLQGGRVSPTIANIVCLAMDGNLMQLAGSACSYTRYGDDVTISGPSLPDRAEVEEVVHRAGFRIGKGSWRLQRKSGGRRLMGLSVGNRRVRLTRSFRKRIERNIRMRERGLPSDPRLDGWLQCYRLVEPRLCASWEERLEAVNEASITAQGAFIKASLEDQP